MRDRSRTSVFSSRPRPPSHNREAATNAHQLLDLVPVAVIEMVRGSDGRDRIAYFNRGATELFGYSAQEAVGAEPAALLRPHVPPERRAEILSELEWTGSWEGEMRQLAKDGRELHVRSHVQAESDADGMQRRLVALEDLTGERELLRDLEQANRELKTATRGKSEFLANMSHEIRTPMNAIIGMTTLLLDGTLESEQAEFAQVIRTSGEHLLTVINDILDLSKTEAGLLSLDLAPFSVSECVQSTIEMVARSAADKGLELIRSVAPDVPARVVGDAGRLRQVLVNLLGNAIKFTDVGEVSLAVSARPSPHGARLLFTVKDTGIGIEASATAALFAPFVQADGPPAGPREGTGLGLAISRTLTEMMGGELSVHSTPGEGSAFTAEIEVAVLSGPEPAPKAQRHNLDGRRVLVIDDNLTAQRITAQYVRELHMEAVCVRSSDAALGLLRAHESFDLCLLDYVLPGLSGPALIQAIRDIPAAARLPIVVLSSTPAARADLIRGGLKDLIVHQKPIRPSVLHDTINSVIAPEAVRHTPVGFVFDPGTAVRMPLKILVVDDNSANQKMMSRMLSRLGYSPDVAGNGRSALVCAAGVDYGLILMDLEMPDLDGLHATERIRAMTDRATTRIIGLSAHDAPDVRAAALTCGMNDYATKPLSCAQLTDILRETFDARQGRPLH
jgi:PAS domain S-box-containing protein